jgi:PhnB protein
MPKRSLGQSKNDAKKIEQLNRAVDGLLLRADGKAAKVEASIEPLMRVAAGLRDLPREEFKARLKAELLGGRKTMSTVAVPVISVHTTATPRLTFKDAAKAIEFYKQAFGAKEIMRFETGGSIPHAEITVGDSTILLSEEWPEGGRFSAETLGSSPVQLSLGVEDVDSFAKRAVDAGVKTIRPIQNQFYGRREGSFLDPFGYIWNISTVVEEMSVEEMHRRMQGMTTGPEDGRMPAQGGAARRGAVDPVRKGFNTVTPYIVTQDAESVVEFAKKTFGAEETLRAPMPTGLHCEVRIGDSMMMIGGGIAGVEWKRDSQLGAFHVYVRDCDVAYKRALAAGGKSLQEPADQFYGERSGSVVDAAGNFWYIATRLSGDYKWEGAPTVQPYLHPLRAEPVINFLKRAFGAEDLGRHTTPEGVMQHATLKIGTSHLEMGEAHGPYQPMKSMFYLYVPNADAAYQRALTAGATSLHEPADQPYGDRSAAVKDAFGNIWYVATHVKDVSS